jgi:hypothetical protein
MIPNEILEKISHLVNSINTIQLELINLKALVIQQQLSGLEQVYFDRLLQKPTLNSELSKGVNGHSSLEDF